MAVSRLVDWRSPPLAGLLDKLLRDMTMGRNVTFMTDGYGVPASETITAGAVRELDVRTRTEKSVEAQAARTKAKAEVFTPAWLVNHMNNKCDEDWFGRPDVFNVEKEKDGKPDWDGNGHGVSFAGTPGWQAYVKLKKLEITCGEAPFVTMRYDAATGARFEGRNGCKKRMGFLDRKLKVVAQQCRGMSDGEKIEWVLEALKSCYGYEYQGDSLLIARANVLLTTLDYCRIRMDLLPDDLPLDEICDIICWNFWQMDGLENVVPGTGERCRIMDWAAGEAVHYDDCVAAMPEAAVKAMKRESDRRDTGSDGGPDGSRAGFFEPEAEQEPDVGFETAGTDRIVASSAGLLVNALPRSTLADDTYAKGEKLEYAMACQCYGMVQGFMMLMDQMDPDKSGTSDASGFGGLVSRFGPKGRVTGAMKSSLRDFRNESYEPLMKTCRDAVEAVLKACLYHQQEHGLEEIAVHDLEVLATMLEGSVLPDGVHDRIAAFAVELEGYYRHGHDFRYTLDARDATDEDAKGMDLRIVVQDVGRLLAICRKYVLGIGI